MRVTLRPLDSRIAAREAAAIPLPRDDTTPPVTNTNLVIAEGAERHMREIQIIQQSRRIPRARNLLAAACDALATMAERQLHTKTPCLPYASMAALLATYYAHYLSLRAHGVYVIVTRAKFCAPIALLKPLISLPRRTTDAEMPYCPCNHSKPISASPTSRFGSTVCGLPFEK